MCRRTEQQSAGIPLPPPLRYVRKGRRGVTAVLAMLYMVLFTTLSIGAYESVTVAVQVSYNERDVNAARAAAESGMEFIRYQLYQTSIPPPYTTAFNTVYTQLAALLNNTANMGANQVTMSNGVIYVPGTVGNWISLDSTGAQFWAQISQGSGTKLIVTVTGQGANTTVQRAVQMSYDLAKQANGIFDYGLANEGTISMAGNAKIKGAVNPAMGSVLSAATSTLHPLTMAANALISGDVSFVEANATPSVTGNATIDGYLQSSPSYSQHIHSGVPAPEFPTIDTTDFATYATNTTLPAGSISGGVDTISNGTLTNTVLPSGNYVFSGNTTIQGVLYVQTPATISFTGNTTITGAVVVQDNPTGTTSTNTISFGGNVTVNSIGTLPVGSTFPAGELTLANVFLLAPNFSVSFSGNFGTIGGSMIAGGMTFSGNAGGTITGSVIGLDNLPMSLAGNSDLIINSTGTTAYPAGVYFSENYAPLADTYAEVIPPQDVRP